MKYAWIETPRKEFELAELCDALAVSASGYHSWKRGGRPDRKRLTDTQMVALLKALHAEPQAVAFHARLRLANKIPGGLAQG